MYILKKLSVFFIFLVISVGLISCAFADNTSQVKKATPNADSQTAAAATSEKLIQSARLKFDSSYYKNDDNNSIKYLYITVSKDQGESQYVFSDLAKDDYQNDDYEPRVNVLFQEGNAEGPQTGYYGYGITDSNASMRVRGRSTRVNGTGFKSYKIELNKKVGEWNNNSELNLNKHPADLTRMRNKLSFDYFKLIPDSATLRTQFVHLFIKDMTKPSPDKDFVNYGLYTHIEQVGKQFLKRSGLDPSGNLYKVVYFEFHRYEDTLKNVDDPGYDKKKFEQNLEIKAGKDHTKLLKMLDDVNDTSLDIDYVFDKHFNRENYLTWMAANLIMGNLDTFFRCSCCCSLRICIRCCFFLLAMYHLRKHMISSPQI